MKLTYILLLIYPILAKDIANKSTNRWQNDENGFPNDSNSSNTGLVSKIRFEKLDNSKPRNSIDLNLTVRGKPELNDKNISYNDSKRKDSKVAETRSRRGSSYHSGHHPDIFDDLEDDFSFDEMGSDVRGYDSYHGSPSNHRKKKRRRRKGAPRYPPIDKDTLYEVGLLIYLRDFHLGMII